MSVQKENFVIADIGVMGMLPLQFGLHMAILNAPMEYMGCEGVETQSQDCIPGWAPALPTSVYALGGLIGSALIGPLINKYGLRKTYTMCAGIFVLGSLILSVSHTLTGFIIARLVTGIGAGAGIVVSPILIKKAAPSEYSGLLGVCTQFCANLGIIVAQVLGLYFAESHWRMIMKASFLISVLTFVFSYTNIWKRGNDTDIPLSTSDPHSSSGTAAHNSSEEPSSEMPQLSASILDLFSHPRYRYTLVIATSIFAVQQLTGINSIIQYGVRIMAEALPDRAKLLNLLISVVNLVVTSMSGFVINKYGPKQMLIVSLASMSLCTAALAFGLIRGLPVFSSMAALSTIAAFALGIGPIPFMYISEFAPRETLGAAQSLGTMSSWISTFAVVALFPSLQTAMGPAVFYVFSISTLAAAVCYAKWLHPDNK